MLTTKIRFDASKNKFKMDFQNQNLHFHSDAIVSMDVCVRKPLIATASKDKTIKIWNY